LDCRLFVELRLGTMLFSLAMCAGHPLSILDNNSATWTRRFSLFISGWHSANRAHTTMASGRIKLWAREIITLVSALSIFDRMLWWSSRVSKVREGLDNGFDRLPFSLLVSRLNSFVAYEILQCNIMWPLLTAAYNIVSWKREATDWIWLKINCGVSAIFQNHEESIKSFTWLMKSEPHQNNT